MELLFRISNIITAVYLATFITIAIIWPQFFEYLSATTYAKYFIIGVPSFFALLTVLKLTSEMLGDGTVTIRRIIGSIVYITIVVAVIYMFRR